MSDSTRLTYATSAAANAMLDFAGQLGLIDSEEDAEIRRLVGRDHPELYQWLEDEDKRLSGES